MKLESIATVIFARIAYRHQTEMEAENIGKMQFYRQLAFSSYTINLQEEYSTLQIIGDIYKHLTISLLPLLQ